VDGMDVTVVGAGLAGCECAYQLARRGVRVRLFEQKPLARTPAHFSDGLAELVCSNSLRSAALVNAVGVLKEEMRRAGSLVIEAGDATRVPAGSAMAVDRERFSAEITRRIDAEPRIERVAAVVEELPRARPLVLATGPLTAGGLSEAVARLVGREHVAYYDSIAPIVSADSIDWDRLFFASRYGRGEADAYANCGLDREQYRSFVAALVAAEKMEAHAFEEARYFEGCLPIEVMAERGEQTLAFGPMKPVGLAHPESGARYHAVVQLRREDVAGSAYNLVGFQTRMTQAEQRRVFRSLPGLEHARFERYGSVHRNTFVRAPEVLDDELGLRAAEGVYLAGQITGVEGYVESAACGLWVGRMLAARVTGGRWTPPPPTTTLGALIGHLRTPREDFQPSNVVWSMVPPLPGKRLRRRARREALAARALDAIDAWLAGEAAGAAGAELAS